jgi:hypothetical protein
MAGTLRVYPPFPSPPSSPLTSLLPSFLSSKGLTRLQDWCAVKAWDDGDMVSEQKLCLFLNTEVVGRESRARGYEGRRKRKLADRRARLGRAEKRRKGKGRVEEVPTDIDTGAGTDPDPDSDSEEEEREPDYNEPMDTASEDGRDSDEGEGEQHGANFGPGAENDDPNADEDTLFRETVGFSVIKSWSTP